ncbi:MAG: N-6 DNA methylase [Candidatus Cloacimonetes bacterium]|nr:N-6 DNA methylase [Candidatus Cloacimonadota bacterium]
MCITNILQNFNNEDNFLTNVRDIFNYLNIPVNSFTDECVNLKNILINNYKDNETFALVKSTFVAGMIDESAFRNQLNNQSFNNIRNINNDYDGIIVFAIKLNNRNNGLLPTRSQLAEISRAFNREFCFTPVLIIFQYSNYISIANTERIPYRQEWRQGEKAGKISILRDISINNPHTGHIKILEEMKISNRITSFSTLYEHWKKVFSISTLNNNFYKELSNWYFWAMNNVNYPSYEKLKNDSEKKEHKAKNLIRLLTRILFIWFIKEKKLISEDLFDYDKIKELVDLNNNESAYYKAILQNLFFAVLNTEMGEREFRKYKKSMNCNHLFRYERFFTNIDGFYKLIEKIPFMNGGLFDCLDYEHPTDKGRCGSPKIAYVDGFSDRDDNQLSMPDYIFWGEQDNVNLNNAYGDNSHNNLRVRGLLDILKSYKFTIEENTPVEEDIALDPELLGRVFENLLASYNPETQDTARRQTGSFYTPREIVNYMVDESLIAYFKNHLKNDEQLDDKLHQLLSYQNDQQPFKDDEITQIINAIDNCKILDPACGSGAFPMGILQKMVYILSKIDPNNEKWKDKQIKKASYIDDCDVRENAISDIQESFINNELDYGRKLYLIENCIFGVDIQPIAIQISKLRFFISLIVDQKVKEDIDNLGIRPLPNLEAKFVAANTLIGIEKPMQSTFFDIITKPIEEEISQIKHKLFSCKSSQKKNKLIEDEKNKRKELAEALIDNNYNPENAWKIAKWNPYNQNESADFFEPEYMFGIKDGFDIVIGNPPYVSVRGMSNEDKVKYRATFSTAIGRFNLFTLFIEKAIILCKQNATLTFIVPNGILSHIDYKYSREKLLNNGFINLISIFSSRVFEASVDTCIISFIKSKKQNATKVLIDTKQLINTFSKNDFLKFPNFVIPINLKSNDYLIFNHFMYSKFDCLENLIEMQQGIIYTGQNPSDIFSNNQLDNSYKKSLDGRDIEKWGNNWIHKQYNKYIKYTNDLHRPREERIFLANPKIVLPRRSTNIYCTIDRECFYLLNTAYVILINDIKKISYEYLACWLNSSLVNYIYSKLYVGWQITIPALCSLRIKVCSKNIERLIFILVTLNPKTFDYILNSLILNIYFLEHMKEREIDIIDLVDSDIEQILKDEDIRNLSERSKQILTDKLDNMWKNPENEVNKRINLFKEKSPDILNVILEY